MKRWAILGPLILAFGLLIGTYVVPRLVMISQLDLKAPTSLAPPGAPFYYIMNGRMRVSGKPLGYRVQHADKMATKGMSEMADGNTLQAAFLFWKAADKLPDASITEPQRDAYLKQAKKALINFFSF